MERQLIEEYIGELDEISRQLSAANHAHAVALAQVPDEIRGYGHVKEKSVAEASVLRTKRRNAFLAAMHDRAPAARTAVVEEEVA